MIVDVNTPEGTFLNGQRITGPTPLSSGDTIGVGRNVSAFRGASQTQVSIGSPRVATRGLRTHELPPVGLNRTTRINETQLMPQVIRCPNASCANSIAVPDGSAGKQDALSEMSKSLCRAGGQSRRQPPL